MRPHNCNTSLATEPLRLALDRRREGGRVGGMNKILSVLLVVLIPVLLVGEPHEWTNAQGKTIKAEFVSATNESVTITMQGKVFVVKLADLSPQSRALAAKLRVQKSTAQQPPPSSETITGK